jgi:hypothetical protein
VFALLVLPDATEVAGVALFAVGVAASAGDGGSELEQRPAEGGDGGVVRAGDAGGGGGGAVAGGGGRAEELGESVRRGCDFCVSDWVVERGAGDDPAVGGEAGGVGVGIDVVSAVGGDPSAFAAGSVSVVIRGEVERAAILVRPADGRMFLCGQSWQEGGSASSAGLDS